MEFQRKNIKYTLNNTCNYMARNNYRPHPKAEEGNVFTIVCLSTGVGRGYPSVWSQVHSQPLVPCLFQDGMPQSLVSLLGGVPQSLVPSGGHSSQWFHVIVLSRGYSVRIGPWLGLGSSQLGLGYPLLRYAAGRYASCVFTQEDSCWY